MKNLDSTVLNKIQQVVKDCTKKPEIYLSVQERISENLKKSTKELYDFAIKSKRVNFSKSEALPELIIDGFDTEQIWQQLELANNEEFGRVNLSEISKALVNNKSWILPITTKEKDESIKSENSNSEDEEMEVNSSEMSENDSIEETIEKKKTNIKKVKKRRRTTEVDDKFFKLDELDEYLQKEDKRETQKNKHKNESSDEDNESIDLFNNLSDLDDNIDEENDNVKETNSRSINYADFFDSPDSCNDEEKSLNDSENEPDDESFQSNSENENYDPIKMLKQDFNKEKKQVKFNLLDNSCDAHSAENLTTKDDSDSDSEDNAKTTKSTLESRQERLKKRIKELEKEAVSEKPWQLKGETSASSRPQNSLLEEYVEFDTVSRPAPVMTEQSTMKLEDIIRQRIKDKTWDDVVKKFKPIDTPMEYKKKLIMNQEKSKESLSQIYENEYIKQREALNLEDKDDQEKQEPPEHIEIREKMHSLFRKLDALTNFHYTPKPAKPEIKIISNLPAINMEEVAPVATSDATLLAPEEVHSKQKGDLIGKSERTKTDMKRERRKKKLKQHARAVNESKKLVDSGKQKKSLKKAVGKLQGRNVINVDQETNKNNSKLVKSSTAFFAQLQDQVENSIKEKSNTSVKKKNKNTLSAVKLKL